MNLRIIIAVELLAVIATSLLVVFWIADPNRNWEPWTVLCGTVAGATELIRRFSSDRKPHGTHQRPALARDHRPTDTSAEWLKRNVHVAKVSESLPRALEFAKRSGNTELERWIRLELYGYNKESGMTDEDVVPEYRAVTGRWIDQFNRVLDLGQYPDISIVNEYRLRFGVAELEELASRREMQNLVDDHVAQIIRQYMDFDVSRFCFCPIEVQGVLAAIRNRLAEMVLDCLADAKRA